MLRLLLAIVFAALAPVANAQSLEPLFRYSAGSHGANEMALRIDVLFLGGHAASRLLLNTPLGDWTATFVRLDTDSNGFRSWVGAIDGIPNSHVVFTERSGVVAGLIDAQGTKFQIRSTGAGSYLLEEAAPRSSRREADPIAISGSLARDSRQQAHAIGDAHVLVADPGRTLDVVILYTPNARAQRGGAAHIEALASQVISDTNTAMARSGVSLRARLVGTRELALVEGDSMVTDLSRLRSSPTARLLRDVAGADLVQLLVSSSDLSTCGVAYLLTSLTEADFDAFSVADIACAAHYTPTHEMAHNLGADHAPEDGGARGLFPYSYGYKDAVRGFRTLMAYECEPSPCPRVLNFSNPYALHLGAPTGSPHQDNARALNEVGPLASNFRSPSALPIPQAPTAPRVRVTGDLVTAEWDRTPATHYVLQVGTAPGSADIFNGSVGAALHASGRLPAGSYYLRLFAFADGLASGPSTETQFTVGAAECRLPSPPTAFGHSVESGTVRLQWAPPIDGTRPITYTLEAGSLPGLADLTSTGVSGETFVVASPPPGTYYVRVRARNDCGISAPSSEIVVRIP